MSNIKYTSNLNGEGGWLTGIELDPVEVDTAPGSEGWEPISAVIDADENGNIEVEYTESDAPVVTGLVLPSTITIENESEDFTGITSDTNTIIYAMGMSGVTNYCEGDADARYAVGYIPSYHDRQSNYSIAFNVNGVTSHGDTMNVLVNGVPLTYNNGAYTYSTTIPANQIAPSLVISITNKE